jgi:hypothetical protein
MKKFIPFLFFILPFFIPAQKTIHVFVALCDNKNQGIVPVNAKIGNGQDPKNNLYWGCGYGVKMFFKLHSTQWSLVKTIKNPKANIYERVIFKHKTENVYLCADAYDGAYIKKTTEDFFAASAGDMKDSVLVDSVKMKYVRFGGASKLICYTGHDGLMDFDLEESSSKKDNEARKTIILACISRKYFKPYLQKTGASPLVWTTGLMAPEAYTLEAAVNAWVAGKSDADVREAAAQAYSKYQKSCSIKAARNLLVTGW